MDRASTPSSVPGSSYAVYNSCNPKRPIGGTKHIPYGSRDTKIADKDRKTTSKTSGDVIS
jgi:hypothetical protein